MSICCLLYNIPHFFEIHAIECIDLKHGGLLSLQICPTDIRVDPLYYTIYYTYAYTTLYGHSHSNNIMIGDFKHGGGPTAAVDRAELLRHGQCDKEGCFR